MSKARKMMEYYRKRFLEYAEVVESEEEQRLAAEYEPKVNLRNILQWSAYMQGARRAILYVMEHSGDYDSGVYRNAVFRLITSDLRYMGMFLTEQNEICFRNHRRDKKGKLVSVEAYFAEKVTVYREV